MSVKKRTYLRGGAERTVWRAKVWTYPPHGGRRELVKEFRTRREAQGWEREQASTARTRDVSAERTTVADASLWDRAEPVLRERLSPKTFRTYRDAWRMRILPAVGGVKLGDLTVGLVERVQAQWATQGLGLPTMMQARAAWSAVLTVAVRDGLIPSNPVRSSARPASTRITKVGQTLRPEQLRHLVAAVRTVGGEPYGTMVDLMGSTGLRYGECAALTCGDVDQRAGVIHVRQSVTEVAGTETPSASRRRKGNLIWGPPKNGFPRDVPIPQHLTDALRTAIGHRPVSALLFQSERSRTVVRRNTLARKVEWSKLTTRLGHPGFRIHDLRATAATNLLAAGVPLHVVRDILGHQDLQVTSRYARSHDDALHQAARSLANYFGSSDGESGGDQPANTSK